MRLGFVPSRPIYCVYDGHNNLIALVPEGTDYQPDIRIFPGPFRWEPQNPTGDWDASYDDPQPNQQLQEQPTMNFSVAALLVDTSIRSVKVQYDPDNARNNSTFAFYKATDDTLKVDDMVVVPTNTRHGFTVAKIVEIDFPVNFDSHEQWGWIVGKVDTTTYEATLEMEKGLIKKVHKIEENKKRAELVAAMNLAEVGNISFGRPAQVTMQQPVEAPPPADAIEPAPAPHNGPVEF